MSNVSTNIRIDTDLVFLTRRQRLNYWNFLKFISDVFISPLTDQQVASLYDFATKDDKRLESFLRNNLSSKEIMSCGDKVRNDEENRIEHISQHFPILNDMCRFSPFAGDDKHTIKIFYLMQWPVNEKLKEKMEQIKKRNGFELDDERKIVKFESEAPEYEMCLQREARFDHENEFNPLPWSISELNMVLSHFCDMLREYSKPESDLKPIFGKISGETSHPKRTVNQLHYKIGQYIPFGKETSEKTYQKKLTTLHQLGLPVPIIFFKEYLKGSFYQLNAERKLIFFSRLGFEIGTQAENPPDNLSPLQESIPNCSMANTMKRAIGQSEEHQESEGSGKRTKVEGGKQVN